MAQPTIPASWPDEGSLSQAAKLNLLANVVLCAPNANVNLSYESVQDTITAKAGGGQASATQITAQLNRVSTVASAADSVKLPASVPGLVIGLINSGANSMQVFGTSPDTINGAATGTGVAQAASNLVTYYHCVSAGAWFSK